MSVWTFDSVSQETIELGRTRTPVDRSVIAYLWSFLRCPLPFTLRGVNVFTDMLLRHFGHDMHGAHSVSLWNGLARLETRLQGSSFSSIRGLDETGVYAGQSCVSVQAECGGLRYYGLCFAVQLSRTALGFWTRAAVLGLRCGSLNRRSASVSSSSLGETDF